MLVSWYCGGVGYLCILFSRIILDFDDKVKEALYIKKQKPLLNKHLHQCGASFLLNVF